MAKPLAQMPYQTVGDLMLTFPATAAVENYRRDLDLATATAHVSYSTGGVRFAREVFASAPDDVIVVRLSADRPGQISFEARLQTPQRATTEATGDGDLVMRGVNGDGKGATADGRPLTGALRFEARVRVLSTGGARTMNGDAIAVRDADAVTLLIAAATSYRNYEDVTADPAARVSASLARVAGKTVDALRDAHVRDYRTLFDRVTFNVGTSAATALPTDQRVSGFAGGGDPALAALHPIRALSPDLQLAARVAARQPPGHLERQPVAAVGKQHTININTQMNYWPGALHEPRGDDGSVDGAGAGSRDHGRAARRARCTARAGGWRITTPISGARRRRSMVRNGGCGRPAARGSRWRSGSATNTRGDRAYLRTIYPLLKGAAEFFVDTLVEEPTHGWLVTSPSLSPENLHPFGTSLVMGPAMDSQILRDLFASATQAARELDVDRDRQTQWTATRTPGAESGGECRTTAGMARRLGHAGARARSSPCVASLRPLSRTRHRRAPHTGSGASSPAISGDARRYRHRVGDRLAHQSVGPARRRQSCLRHLEISAEPRTDVSESLRCPSALPDRWQLWRRRWHGRDARAVRRRRDSTAAGASVCMAGR